MSPRSDERMIAIALRAPEEGTLEGVYQAPAGAGTRGAVIAAPHPLYGGSMDSPVVSEVAWACVRAGIAALRFNWRGVGASTGVASGATDDADRDFGAALAYLAETVPGKLVAAGYSFGAVAATRAAALHPRIDRLILVAPPGRMLPAGAFETGRPTLAVCGAQDTLAPAGEVAALAEGRPQVRLRIAPRADHFFQAGLGELGRYVSEWLAEIS
jgi:alpha/beta superfamily hydrolase